MLLLWLLWHGIPHNLLLRNYFHRDPEKRVRNLSFQGKSCGQVALRNHISWSCWKNIVNLHRKLTENLSKYINSGIYSNSWSFSFFGFFLVFLFCLGFFLVSFFCLFLLKCLSKCRKARRNSQRSPLSSVQLGLPIFAVTQQCWQKYPTKLFPDLVDLPLIQKQIFYSHFGVCSRKAITICSGRK